MAKTKKSTGTKRKASTKSATTRSGASAKSRSSSQMKSPKGSSASVDRRRSERRKEGESADGKATRTIERRQKVNRRRQIDPTTCERDYSTEEIEFMNALDDYKRSSGRMFPTCSEVLEVIRALGYEKRDISASPVVDSTVSEAGTDTEPHPSAGYEASVASS